MSQFFFLDPMVAIGEPSYIHSHSFDLLCFRYWVDLTSVGNTPPGSSTSTAYTPVGYSLAVILDSGTSYSYIPQSLFNEILHPECVVHIPQLGSEGDADVYEVAGVRRHAAPAEDGPA